MHDVEEMKLVLEALRADLAKSQKVSRDMAKFRKGLLAEILMIRRTLQTLEGTS